MRAPKHRTRRAKALRILTWTVIIALALTSLFYVFEFVVPRLLPENF
ncbi:MAG: hypothetical protein ACRDJF_09270 [Actinomycetota bacterium]